MGRVVSGRDGSDSDSGGVDLIKFLITTTPHQYITNTVKLLTNTTLLHYTKSSICNSMKYSNSINDR